MPGLFGIARMERELSAIFGRKVDLRTAEDLSRYFRQDVLREAEVQFLAGGGSWHGGQGTFGIY